MSANEFEIKRNVRSFLAPREPSLYPSSRPAPKREGPIFPDVVEDSYDAEEDTATSLETNDSSSNSDAALVYLRLRPIPNPTAAYTLTNDGNIFVVGPNTDTNCTSTNRNNVEKHYSFSAIFNGDVEQREVYEKCIGKRIELEESFTVLTYGTSGSGKTFTLLGDINSPGIIPRAVENIFTLYSANIYPAPALKLINARINIVDDHGEAVELLVRERIFALCEDMQSEYECQQKRIRSEQHFETKDFRDISVVIWVSFVEIYNESVHDLLDTSAAYGQQKMKAPRRKNLRIVNNNGSVFIKGLTSVCCKSSLEALKLLRYGLQHVTYASTSINSNSSRSHCIFFVDVLKYCSSGVATEVCYKFCDLAGSERVVKTGNVGNRLKEAQSINSSLMVLGRCLDAANASRKGNGDMIPYRESKLTMLLQSSLLGREKLTMIVNVMPCDKYYEENSNVLEFSSIAKNIVFKKRSTRQNRSRFSIMLEQSIDGSPNKLVKLQRENTFLQSENERLRDELDMAEKRHKVELIQQEHVLRNNLVDSFEVTLAQNRKQSQERLQIELNNQRRIFEAKIDQLKRQHEVALEDLRDEYEEEKENRGDVQKKRISFNL